MSVLSSKAVLVSLNISQWTARKYDRKASKQVSDTFGIDQKVGRYNKSLLCGMDDLLKEVHKKSGAIRNMYYENTLPWGIDGTQMLPAGNYLDFLAKFRQAKSDWQTSVDRFLNEYPTLRANAQQVLGTLYDPADYPSPDQVRDKFKLDVAVLPVPEANDFRIDMMDSEMQRIQEDMEVRLQDAANQAMAEVWSRLYERVQHINSKLSDPTAIFRDSMIENARELCAILPKLNVTDDPDLEAMRQEVERELASDDPRDLRVDLDLRKEKAAKAEEIMRKMGAFMQ